MIFPLLATIISAINAVWEKTIYNHKRTRYKTFVFFSFLFAFFIISIFFYPFLGEIKQGAFSFWMIIALLAIILTASLRNVLFYSGFQREGLSEIQPFLVFSPLLTILVASVLYPDERNLYVLALAIFAGLVLILSHLEKKHLKFDKGLVPIMGAVLLEAVENNITKELLYFYSPTALYTLRIGLVSLVLFFFLKPTIKDMTKKEIGKILLASLMWVLVMIFYYTGFQQLGVVQTVLICMMGPFLVVLGSYTVLKEKRIRKRDIIALVIIIGCVIASQFLK